MQTKYFGMRFVVPSGGSFKVTIPKEIVDQVWQRKYTEFFPVCFIQLNEKRARIKALIGMCEKTRITKIRKGNNE
jgi:hypothetical protein